MKLFSKKENSSSCENNCDTEAKNNADTAKDLAVKILGSGCAKCNQLEANVVEVLKQAGMSAEIEHVTDFAKIAAFGVMTTPALVINGKIVSVGKVLKTDEIISILQK